MHMGFESFPTPKIKKENPVEQPVKNAEKAWSDRVDEIVITERDKQMPEMLKLATKGLGELFEHLPKNQDITEENLTKLLDNTELRIMLPGMRKMFAEEVFREKINQIGDKEQFIVESLDTEALKLFINAEALKASTDDSLQHIREARESLQSEPEQQTEVDKNK